MLKITINNQFNQDIFYSEVNMRLIENHLVGLDGPGFVWVKASRSKDMNNIFEVMINPKNCSVITYQEVD